MKISHSQVIITRIKKSEDTENSAPKKRFFRRRKYIDKLTPSLVWDAGDTYEENKRMCLNALGAVSRGEYKNIYEAYDAYCG